MSPVVFFILNSLYHKIYFNQYQIVGFDYKNEIIPNKKFKKNIFIPKLWHIKIKKLIEFIFHFLHFKH